ncbi:uncharacterized protein EI97DRAFT_443261 [Westerdykella ornata]|uniref:Uncharacterized protein n=1 Tax=Westerdykella ornata TaxID=318751 RepID=A0A6A6JKJ0_WESOR|nr:uncharacterized protein EI97DRAFT_443261 [Westerdykella ornata]KAF2275399.1 hypothetical protein EI97DRAFT_443261 [Westerdykella ornata]
MPSRSPFAVDMASESKSPDRNEEVDRPTSPAASEKDAPEPFPSYIEPHHFDAATMDAEGPLGLDNVRYLTAKDRQALLEGGLKLEILIGDKWVCSMPWRLFQALSTKATEISDSDPKVRQLRLPAGLSKMPFLYILEWLKQITTSSHFCLLKRRNDASEDISVCRAARLLGMTEYAQHIFNHYWFNFNNTTPSFDDISAVEQLATTEEKIGLVGHDGAVLLDCIVKRLAYMVVNKKVPDSTALAEFLQKHPKVLGGIAEIVNPTTTGGIQGTGQNTSTLPPFGRSSMAPLDNTATSQNTRHLSGQFGQHLTQPLPMAHAVGQSQSFLQSNSTGVSSIPLMLNSAVDVGSAFRAVSGNIAASHLEARPLNERLKGTHATYAPDLAYGNLASGSAYVSAHALSDINQAHYNLNSCLNMGPNNSDAIPATFGRRNTLSGQFRPPYHMVQDDMQKIQPLPQNTNIGAIGEGFGSGPQTSAPHFGTQPFPTASDSPLLAAAKKMFPQPENKNEAYLWASQHATALLEQNTHFREERSRAAVQPNFTFTKDTWSPGHAPVLQELPRADGAAMGHRTKQSWGDKKNA